MRTSCLKIGPKTYGLGDVVHFRCFSGTILGWEDHEEDGYDWRSVRLKLDDGREIECDWLDLEEVQANVEVVDA